MTKKETFINIIQTVVFDQNYDEWTFSEQEWNDALEYFESLKKEPVSKGMTENGKKILKWMQENQERMTNLFTSKEIGEGLFISGRSVAGSIKKLVTDGYVMKQGQNPIQYSLTESGIEYDLIS
jgi:predicted HTH transcriptional regulator